MTHHLAHRHGHRVHCHAGPDRHRHVGLAFRRARPLSDSPPSNRRHGDHHHAHGLVDETIKRSRDGVRVVVVSLGILGVAAIAQTVIFFVSGSVALLADLIHNAGDALTAVPLAIAFTVRSERAERRAGLAVVGVIFASACVAAGETIQRLIHPTTPSHLVALAGAGAIGAVANYLAAVVRTRAGNRLDSAALVADGNHARVDAYVSASVVLSALLVALGAPIGDPLVGLAITLVILRVTWRSWRTIRDWHRH